MPKKEVNGFEMYYEIHGSGTPLVMIMGLGANAEWWEPEIVDALSEDFQVILLDNRGAGRSNDPGGKFTIQTLAEDTAKLLEKMKISRAHILGISMGGMIAQEFALNFPNTLIKLVLCSTYCGGSKSVPPSTDVIKILTKPRKGRSVEEIVDETIPLLYSESFIENNPKVIENAKEKLSRYPISAKVFKKQGAAIFSHNTCRQLKNIKNPALIMHGKEDILLPVENAEVLHNLIPHSEVALFKKSAHALFSQETEAVISRLKDFLKK